TIPTLQRTAERIMEQLTTTRRQGPTAGRKLPTANMDRQRAGQRTIPIRVLPHAAAQCQRPTAAEVQHKRTIRTPERMLRPDKVRVPRLSGVALMCRTETRAPIRNITRRQTEQLPRRNGHKAERPRLRARPGGTAPPLRPSTGTWTPG